MAATAEMLTACIDVRPNACCIVPENRNERTTEGGLDVAGQHNFLAPFIRELMAAGVRVSLFIDPHQKQIEAAASTGAPVIEIHTGAYHEACATSDRKKIGPELDHIRRAAEFAAGLGLEVHAGHGLTFQNVQPVAAIPQIVELNIGHFIVSEAVFMGLAAAVKEMKQLMTDARAGGLY
jgi:pyridoxine 5-phosphate synthase